MRHLPLCSALAALLLLAPGAMAQTEQPAAGQNQTTPRQAEPVTRDTFVATVMSSDQFEIRSSKLVTDAGGTGDVNAFGKQMIEDHTASSQKLMEAIKAAGGQPPSTEPQMLPKHQEMLQQIQGAGEKLEETYLQLQLQAHQEAVALFSSYAQNGDDPAIVAFAKETLPVLQQHLEHVQALSQKRAGSTNQ